MTIFQENNSRSYFKSEDISDLCGYWETKTVSKISMSDAGIELTTSRATPMKPTALFHFWSEQRGRGIRVPICIAFLYLTFFSKGRGDLGARGAVPVLQGDEGSEEAAEGREQAGGQEGGRGEGDARQGSQGRARVPQGAPRLPRGVA